MNFRNREWVILKNMATLGHEQLLKEVAEEGNSEENDAIIASSQIIVDKLDKKVKTIMAEEERIRGKNGKAR